jgi:hypothetical protein
MSQREAAMPKAVPKAQQAKTLHQKAKTVPKALPCAQREGALR